MPITGSKENYLRVVEGVYRYISETISGRVVGLLRLSC